MTMSQAIDGPTKTGEKGNLEMTLGSGNCYGLNDLLQTARVRGCDGLQTIIYDSIRASGRLFGGPQGISRSALSLIMFKSFILFTFFQRFPPSARMLLSDGDLIKKSNKG